MKHESNTKRLVQWIGFVLGPLLACVCLMTLPDRYPSASEAATSLVTEVATEAALPVPMAEFSWAGRATLAVMVWMGVWWLTEAININATALLPIVLFPPMGVADIGTATAPYANYLIFLYFGGFVIALAMERWGLGKRIALRTLAVIGTSAPAMVAGFMLVTALLSAFVSNTATTAMMLPIAVSTIALVTKNGSVDTTETNSDRERFGTCLLLGIAYAASVGGIMTMIGTPPNAFLIGFLQNNISEPYRYEISFTSWLPIGFSVTAVFLPLIYLLLTRVIFPIKSIELEGGKEMVRSELSKLGHVGRGEWVTLGVFSLTVGFWLTRRYLTGLGFTWNGDRIEPFAGLTDTGIAMTAALALFMLPVNLRKRQFAMDWPTLNKMPWGILILFGGGLSLANAVSANGVAEFLGSYANAVGQLPLVLTVLLVTAAIVFLTELTSNLATTTSLVPVLAAIAPGIGIHPYLLIFPATLAASCAFMLPVATPPNAIVFGSGEISLNQMMKAGLLLNLFAVVLVTLVTFCVVRPLLGI
jgi:sodium-dependent dicarboxylate transporter 2/3/5